MSKMNPYEMFLKQVDEAAPFLNVEQEFIDILKEPKEVLEITIPLKLEDGTVKVVKGWRSHHNNALGPYKGGVRYHANVCKDEVMALSAWMSIKCATAMLPYGGGKGGVRIAPRELSAGELERLSRAYALGISRFMGTDVDIPAPDVYTTPQIMAWFVDTYEKVKGWSEPSCFTGKPIEIGGSLGRGDATARGGMYVLREALKDMGLLGKPLTATIQGYGNAGSFAHALYEEIGLKVVGASDSKGGDLQPQGARLRGFDEAQENERDGFGLSWRRQGDDGRNPAGPGGCPDTGGIGRFRQRRKCGKDQGDGRSRAGKWADDSRGRLDTPRERRPCDSGRSCQFRRRHGELLRVGAG